MLARAALGIPRYPLRLLRALPSALPNVEDTPFGVLPGASIAGGLGRGSASSSGVEPRHLERAPGPRIPLYCAGARLVANYPVSVITDGMEPNITVMSYLGKLILVRRGMLPYLRGSRRAELHTHDGRRHREGSPTGHRDGRLVGSGHRRSAGGAP